MARWYRRTYGLVDVVAEEQRLSSSWIEKVMCDAAYQRRVRLLCRLHSADAAIRVLRPSLSVAGRAYGSACLVIHFTDGVDHRVRLIELDIFRTIAGEDLFRIRRQTEPARLG